MRRAGATHEAVLWAAGTGLALTAVVTAVPDARFAYENPSLRVGLETAVGVIAALLAFLAVGRLRITGQARDLALAWSFGMFAATSLFVSAVPIAAREQPGGTATWTALLLRLAAGVAFAYASLAPHRRVRVDTRLAGLVAVASAAVVGASFVAGAAADAWLAVGLDPRLSPEASNRPLLVGHPLLLAAQLSNAGLFAVAAVGFSRRAARAGDPLLTWLAAGSALNAVARLNYFLFPSLYSRWVYTGDALRLAVYVLFLVGAGRELVAYWRDRAEVAVYEERRRMARELHDGLTQELSFIRSQTAGAAEVGLSPATARFVAEAAERAVIESRRVIAVLTGTGDRQLAAALRQAAEDVAGRNGTRVSIEVHGQGTVPTAVQAELVRIVREATGNAVRHGRASTLTVKVALSADGGRLTVVDDGAGFDVAADGGVGGEGGAGFGLTSMRERARAIGGVLDLRSTPGVGTEIELRWS